MKPNCKFSLKDFNSFAVEAYAQQVFQLVSKSQLSELKGKLKTTKKRLVIGSGSNILFREDFPGIVIVNQLKGKEIVSQDDDSVIIMVAAGENWHGLVRWSIANEFYGLENLSLIPGTVGAAPIQNIGAYGVELKQYFHSLTAIDLVSGQTLNFDYEQCRFGYRDSIFKSQLDRYLITSVSFRLNKIFQPVLNYSGVQEKLAQIGGNTQDLTALELSDAICELRTNKLPLPELIGNVGSFFKNPAVSNQDYIFLLSQYPNIPMYRLSEDLYKIPAAWLIEQCGWKGFRDGNIGVYDKHALVLVNYGQATGIQLWQLAARIQLSVADKFGINLQPEPRIL